MWRVCKRNCIIVSKACGNKSCFNNTQYCAVALEAIRQILSKHQHRMKQENPQWFHSTFKLPSRNLQMDYDG
eukprot:1145822-Pelagomonas_calceolata.AAC.4